MEELIKALRVDIPKAFESKEYEKQKNQIVEEFQRKQSELVFKAGGGSEAEGVFDKERGCRDHDPPIEG